MTDHARLGRSPLPAPAVPMELRRRPDALFVHVILAALALSALACARPAPTGRVVDVAALDYAYQAPDSLDAGPALVRLRNGGKVDHELIIMKLASGVSIRDLVSAHDRDESFRPLVEGGNAVLFAAPGDTSAIPLLINFEPGRQYVLWCNFKDADDKPPHATLGMYKVMSVRLAAAVATITPPAHSHVVDAGDYFFSLPDTLPAGLTDFRMRNIGQQRHELALSGLKPGITAAFLLSEEMKRNNVDSLFDGDAAILTAYGGEDNTVAMRVDLVSGRTYILACLFRDADDKPPHTTLGMFREFVAR